MKESVNDPTPHTPGCRFLVADGHHNCRPCIDLDPTADTPGLTPRERRRLNELVEMILKARACGAANVERLEAALLPDGRKAA